MSKCRLDLCCDRTYLCSGDHARISFEDFDLVIDVKNHVSCDVVLSKGNVELNFKRLDVKI